MAAIKLLCQTLMHYTALYSFRKISKPFKIPEKTSPQSWRAVYKWNYNVGPKGCKVQQKHLKQSIIFNNS